MLWPEKKDECITILYLHVDLLLLRYSCLMPQQNNNCSNNPKYWSFCILNKCDNVLNFTRGWEIENKTWFDLDFCSQTKPEIKTKSFVTIKSNFVFCFLCTELDWKLILTLIWLLLRGQKTDYNCETKSRKEIENIDRE